MKPDVVTITIALQKLNSESDDLTMLHKELRSFLLDEEEKIEKIEPIYKENPEGAQSGDLIIYHLALSATIETIGIAIKLIHEWHERKKNKDYLVVVKDLNGNYTLENPSMLEPQMKEVLKNYIS